MKLSEKIKRKVYNLAGKVANSLAQDQGGGDKTDKSVTPGMPELLRSVAAQGAVLKGMLDGKVQPKSFSLAAGSWSNLTQTVSVSGVTSDSIVLVTPAPASYTVYHGCGVFCSSQGDGTLTFSAVNKPETALTVQILLIA